MTGGALSGRRLRAPAGTVVRPTADRVREALFQILARRLRDASVLDLYAGSGALGIEALSRGARSCVLVERSRPVAAVCRRNLAELGLLDRSRIIVGEVERRLAALARSAERPFDVIMMDPPYRRARIPEIVARLEPLLAPGGCVVWEHQRGAAEAPAGWRVVDRRAYGQTEVTILAP